MSPTALLVDGSVAPAATPPDGSIDRSEQGLVSVHHLGLGNATASCSCGWAGRRRILKAAAEQDAWLHSMHDRCEVSSPLVLAW
jgi:hypothetical protein